MTFYLLGSSYKNGQDANLFILDFERNQPPSALR